MTGDEEKKLHTLGDLTPEMQDALYRRLQTELWWEDTKRRLESLGNRAKIVTSILAGLVAAYVLGRDWILSGAKWIVKNLGN